MVADDKLDPLAAGKAGGIVRADPGVAGQDKAGSSDNFIFQPGKIDPMRFVGSHGDMEGNVTVQLPQSRHSKAISEPVTVTVPMSFRRDRRVRLGKESVALEVLAERVKQALYGQTEQGVILAGDGGITLQELFTIADQLMAGGVRNVALQSQPPTGR